MCIEKQDGMRGAPPVQQGRCIGPLYTSTCPCRDGASCCPPIHTACSPPRARGVRPKLLRKLSRPLRSPMFCPASSHDSGSSANGAYSRAETCMRLWQRVLHPRHRMAGLTSGCSHTAASCRTCSVCATLRLADSWNSTIDNWPRAVASVCELLRELKKRLWVWHKLLCFPGQLRE